jgi:signal transduction histidine kinase
VKMNPKISRIRWLMIFSQLLLIVFICQWIINRYNQEKATLFKQLQIEFIDSEQAMADSLILSNVIDPFIKSNSQNLGNIIIDTINSKDQLISTLNKQNDFVVRKSNRNDFFDSSAIKNITIDKRNGKNAMILTFKSGADTNENISKNTNRWQSVDGIDKVLAHTYKVYINRSIGTNGSAESIYFSSATNADTSLLKNEFDRRLDNYKLKSKWVDTSLANLKPYFYFQSKILDLNIGAEIKNPGLYILKKLTPTIIFGLILLLLTGIAFSISFLNLKKQIQLNAIRNDFISNITHELKTPVSTVKVALEAIQKYDIKANPVISNEYIQIAIHEAERLDMLIQKVLLSSVLDGNNNALNIELINLSEIIEDVLKAMQIRFDNEKANVIFIKPKEDILLHGDKIHLQGILFNLLDNSLKYNDSLPEIQIKLVKSGKNSILSISDNGIGIPDEYKTKIFEKFFRVPSGNKHNVKGYGLGLNYALSVIQKHKGAIEVINNTNNGCTFTITIPV